MPSFNIIRFDSLESTNDYAFKHMEELEHGTVILAETQTAGHGRLDRSWVSHIPNNIYISLVLKPDLPLDENSPLAAITQYMSLVIVKVLNTYEVLGKIRWPNDVLVDEKKICGLLSQSSIKDNKLIGYVLGTGINLNMPAEIIAEIDQPATALNLITQMPVNREGFLARLLELFFAGLDDFLEQGFPSINMDYRKNALYLGRGMIAYMPDRTITGRAIGYDDNGRLRLIDKSGDIQIVTAGDVRLEDDTRS